MGCIAANSTAIVHRYGRHLPFSYHLGVPYLSIPEWGNLPHNPTVCSHMSTVTPSLAIILHQSQQIVCELLLWGSIEATWAIAVMCGTATNILCTHTNMEVAQW